ncbi:MAG: AAA family ATPase [Roseococcus sp.]
MSDDVTGRKYSEEDQQPLRERLLEVKERERLTWETISTETGVKVGSLTPWAVGKYNSNGGPHAGSPIAEKVERWLASRETRATIRAAAPDLRFVMTPSASDFMGMLANTQALAHIGVLTGAPGIGKSRAACEYKRRNPNVFKVTGSRFISTVPQLLSALAREMGAPDTGRQDRIAANITRRLIGSQGLIIVDEAQLLTLDQMEVVRSFHDLAGAGLALIGNPSVMRKLEGGHRSSDYAQFFSRVGMRLNRPKAKIGDMEALLDAWSADDPKVRLALRAVAKQGGALRSAFMTFMLARMVANNEDRSLSAADVKLAWTQISDQLLQIEGEAA